MTEGQIDEAKAAAAVRLATSAISEAGQDAVQAVGLLWQAAGSILLSQVPPAIALQAMRRFANEMETEVSGLFGIGEARQ